MPNHCENDLTITGSSDLIDRIINKMGLSGEKPSFDFNSMLPYPTKFKDKDREAELARKDGDYTVKDGYNQGGYDWCCRNWGTKWNAYQVTLPILSTMANGKKRLKVSFQTAWAPPIPVIEKLAQEFPMGKIDLRYYECGMAFKGKLVFEDGEETFRSEGTYHGHRGG